MYYDRAYFALIADLLYCSRILHRSMIFRPCQHSKFSKTEKR